MAEIAALSPDTTGRSDVDFVRSDRLSDTLLMHPRE